MSKKKMIIITCLIGFLIVIVAYQGISKYKHAHPVYSVSSINNVIEVVGNKADKNLKFSCYITVEKDEKIVVTSSIKTGAIKINLKHQELDEGFEETFIGKEAYEYDFPEGLYRGICVVMEDKTTGHIKINVEEKDNKITEEMAYEGVSNYCHSMYDWSIAEDNPDIMYVNLGEESETEYQVIFRSYTGAFVYFYVDKSNGTTRMVEYVPNLDIENEIGTIDIYDYLKTPD